MSRKPVELRYSLLRLQAPASEPAGGSGRAGRLLSYHAPADESFATASATGQHKESEERKSHQGLQAVANLMRFLHCRSGRSTVRLPARRIGDADRGDGRARRRKQSKGATSPQPAPARNFVRHAGARRQDGRIEREDALGSGGRLEEPDGSEQQTCAQCSVLRVRASDATIINASPNKCPAILARRAGSRRSSPTHRKAKHAWPNSVNPDARLPLQAGAGLRAGQPEDEPEPQRGRRLDPDPPPWK